MNELAAFLPDRARIEDALAPFTKLRLPLASPEWRLLAEDVARRERRRFHTRRLFGWLPRRGRSQTQVSAQYEALWREQSWPRRADPNPAKRGICATWGSEGLLIRHAGFGIKRVQHLLLSAVIRALRPRSVLEVGCGTGLNLFALSALHPGIEWTGIELTEAGVARARAAQAQPALDRDLQEFLMEPVADPTAYRRIAFHQGDVRAMPFADRAFDLVIAVQALEQMQALRDAALGEIARVTAGHGAFVEPFRDFNRSRTQTQYRRSNGYLDLAIDELPRFGFKPVAVFDDMPQKLTLGVGLVLAARL